MEVKKIKYGKKSRAKSLTVQMSVDEAGVIAKMLGQTSFETRERMFPNVDPEVGAEIYYCLSGEFFNKFWDDGVDGWHNGVPQGLDF